MDKKWLKVVIQAFFVGLIALIGIKHQVVGGGPNGAPPLDSYCPLGGIETLITYFTTGEFIHKTNYSNLVILAATLITVAILGTGFCSWICPLGTIQEWIGKIRKVLGLTAVKVPKALDSKLRYLKYVLLILIVGLTATAGSLVFEEYCPFKIIFHFNFETYLAIGILVVFLLLALFIERFWCRYLCPMGAIFSIMNTLKISRLFKGLKANSIMYPLVLLVIFFGVIGLSMATGIWESKQSLPERHENENGVVETVDLEEIKGYMTLADLENLFGVDSKAVLHELGADEDIPKETKLKDLKAQLGIDMEVIREIVQNLRGE